MVNIGFDMKSPAVQPASTKKGGDLEVILARLAVTASLAFVAFAIFSL